MDLMELDIIPNFMVFIVLQYGGHVDLCGGGSTLPLLNPLSPESNACSDMQKTGGCACMLHILYI